MIENDNDIENLLTHSFPEITLTFTINTDNKLEQNIIIKNDLFIISLNSLKF